MSSRIDSSPPFERTRGRFRGREMQGISIEAGERLEREAGNRGRDFVSTDNQKSQAERGESARHLLHELLPLLLRLLLGYLLRLEDGQELANLDLA